MLLGSTIPPSRFVWSTNSPPGALHNKLLKLAAPGSWGRLPFVTNQLGARSLRANR